MHARQIARDRTLVRALIEARARAYRTRALGLLAPWADCCDAAMVLARAEGARVEVERLD